MDELQHEHHYYRFSLKNDVALKIISTMLEQWVLNILVEIKLITFSHVRVCRGGGGLTRFQGYACINHLKGERIILHYLSHSG